MKTIQEAVAAYLESACGVKTVSDRTRVRGEYPLLAVSVKSEGTVLIAGGRQAEQTYLVTVTAVGDRARDGTTGLLSSLALPLLRGIPTVLEGEQRTLHPLNIETDGEELTFSLVLCVPVPPVSTPDAETGDTMHTLHFAT